MQEQQSYLQRRFADPIPSRIYWTILSPLALVIVAVAVNSFPVALLAYGLIWSVNHLSSLWHRRRFARTFYSEANLATKLLPLQFELLPDRLTVSNAVLVHHYFWPGFQFLRETNDYFYLFFSPVSSLAVPKSAFDSETARQAFRDAIKVHQAANDSRRLIARAEKQGI